MIRRFSFVIVGVVALGTLNSPTVADDLKALPEKLKQVTNELQQTHDEIISIDYELVRTQLRTFTKSTALAERVRAANALALVQFKLDRPENIPSKFSPKELATIKAARDYVVSLNRAADKFERGLSAAEINAITKDNPESMFRAMRRLSILSRSECTKQAYEALKQKMGVDELLAKGQPVMILAGVYEDAFIPGYIARISDLLGREKKYAPVKDKLIAYYSTLGDLFPGHRIPERIADNERKLVEAGVPKEKLKNYVGQTAAQSPECLGGLNIPFVKFSRTDLLNERGKYLLHALATEIARTGVRPEKLDAVPIREGHPIYGERQDPFGRDYVIRYQGKSVSLTSLGGDDENGEDDVFIGTATLP